MKRMLLILVLALAFAFPVFAIEPDEACESSNSYYLDTLIYTGPVYLCGFQVSSETGFKMSVYDNTSASGVSAVAELYSGTSPTAKGLVPLNPPIFMKTGIYVDIWGGVAGTRHTASGVTTTFTDKASNPNNRFIIYYKPR